MKGLVKNPPPHPISEKSQSTNCWGENVVLIFPCEWMQNLSETTSDAEWAQQEPHFPWFLTGWMQSGDFSLQSKLSGS